MDFEQKRFVSLGVGLAVAMFVVRRLTAGSAASPRGRQSRPVSKAFTINRGPDEVAQRWHELDPLGDIVEHVRFDMAPGRRGTEIHIRFHPRRFGRQRPGQVQERLRQFKQLVETGEVARSDISTRRLTPATPLLAVAGGLR